MSCKLELELCGYVKDNCTEALKTCDFDCEDSEMSPVQVVVYIIFYIAIAYAAYKIYKYCEKRDEDKRQRKEDARVGAQIRNYTDVAQVPQGQVVAVGRATMPVIQGRILPEQVNKYDLKNFTQKDLDEFNKVTTGQQDYMTTHDGVIIDKDLTIAGRTRGSALNQPTVF